MDPVTWQAPEVFNPSRHLTEEGKIIKKEEYIAFSVGRCPVGKNFNRYIITFTKYLVPD